MKKIYVLAFMLACFHLISKAQNPIPNPSFEDWSNGVDPDFWTTTNYGGLVSAISQVSPGNTGDFAAKGQAADDGIGDIIAPLLILNNGGSGIAVNTLYSTFEFSYKCHLVNGDTLVAGVIIYTPSGRYIGGAQQLILTDTSVFTLVDAEMGYVSDSVAKAIVVFSINSKAPPDIESYFIIDDVSLLGGGTVGVSNLSLTNKLAVYPVPAHDWLTVKGQIINNKPMEFMLTDATGRVVMNGKSQTPSNNFIDEELNLRGIAPGFYSLTMITDEKVQVRKIAVE